MTVDREMEQTLFTLILHAGNARSKAKEAAEYASQGEWDQAKACLDEANAEQLEAHKLNVGIIRREAAGAPVPFSVLLVHAMDLLLLAWSELDYTEQYIQVSRRLRALEAEVAEWQRRASTS
ncbi:MAG: PTS lactose/cellobiose transporter subunit IIA [Chloroflexota bacterium]